MELLQEFIFIPLDIFRDIQHNRGITNKLEAWLTLLSVDEPEAIVGLIGNYPEFRSIYEEIYELCRNIEKVMGMFSEELLELDRNTVDYMIDEMQNTIDAQKAQLEKQKAQLEVQDEQLEEQNKQLEEQDEQLEKQKVQLEKQDEQLEEQNKKLKMQEKQLEKQNEQLEMQEKQLEKQNKQLEMQRLQIEELSKFKEIEYAKLYNLQDEIAELKKKLAEN